jgi:hypothetical protein
VVRWLILLWQVRFCGAMPSKATISISSGVN